MSDFLYDQFGIKRKISDIRAVEHLENLKKKSGSNPWPVIEACFKIWSERNPQKWDSYIVHLDDIKKTRKDKKFASAYDKVHGGYLRYTLDIPQPVIFMIRMLYGDDELPMTREFFQEFAKRFPNMKIAEKL